MRENCFSSRNEKVKPFSFSSMNFLFKEDKKKIKKDKYEEQMPDEKMKKFNFWDLNFFKK